MTDTIIGSFIGVGGAIVGAAIAGIISYCVATNITRKQELYREYTIFKEAFDKELAFLVSDIESDSSIHGTTYDILTKALNKHRHAVNMFLLVLPSEKRECFNKTWVNYQYPNGYNKAAPFPLLDYEGGVEKDKKDLAHSKITKLLEFAKPK